MELREQAAIAAMQGIVASSLLTNHKPEEVAKEAVKIADALIKELGVPVKRQRFSPESKLHSLGGVQTYDRVVKDTGKATLFDIKGEGFWIPNKAFKQHGTNSIKVDDDFQTTPVELMT